MPKSPLLWHLCKGGREGGRVVSEGEVSHKL